MSDKDNFLTLMKDKLDYALLGYFEGLTTTGLYKLLGITLAVAIVLFLL